EATRDAILVSGAHRAVSVKGNYFEANVGRSCVELRDILGPYSVGPNNYGLLDYDAVDHKVLLVFCGHGASIDPYWPYVVHKLPAPLIGAAEASALKNGLDSDTYGICRMDRLAGANWSARPPAIASAVAEAEPHSTRRETNPQTGFAMPVQVLHTSDKTHAEHRLTISGDPGQWVFISWLFKRQPDGGPPAEPFP